MTESTRGEDGDVILDQETSELYMALEDKSGMVSAKMMLFLNELDKMEPETRKIRATEINADLNAILRKALD